MRFSGPDCADRAETLEEEERVTNGRGSIKSFIARADFKEISVKNAS